MPSEGRSTWSSPELVRLPDEPDPAEELLHLTDETKSAEVPARWVTSGYRVAIVTAVSVVFLLSVSTTAPQLTRAHMGDSLTELFADIPNWDEGEIQLPSTGHRLEVPGTRNSAGIAIGTGPCLPGNVPYPSTRFIFPKRWGQIRWAANPDKCLGRRGSDIVRLWPCSEGAGLQQWAMPGGGRGALRLKGAPRMCLTHSPPDLGVSDCPEHDDSLPASQVFRLAPQEIVVLYNQMSGKYLNAREGGPGNSSTAVVGDESVAPSGQWYIHSQGTAFTLRSAADGRYLNVWSGSAKDGTPVVTWDNPSSPDSQWLLEGWEGSQTLRNVKTSQYLTASGTRCGGGDAEVVIGDARSSPASQWAIRWYSYSLRSPGAGACSGGDDSAAGPTASRPERALAGALLSCAAAALFAQQSPAC